MHKGCPMAALIFYVYKCLFLPMMGVPGGVDGRGKGAETQILIDNIGIQRAGFQVFLEKCRRFLDGLWIACYNNLLH
jgi:hypothetical protein